MSHRLGAGVAVAALVLALPTAGYAVGLLGNDASLVARGDFATAFTPASGDPRVAQIVAERSRGAAKFMRFTPAGSADTSNRRVTVAVRIDQEAARAISVRSSGESESASTQGLRIAPTRYNLGLSRGYQSFAKPSPAAPVVAAAAAASPLPGVGIPDLASFEPSPGVQNKPSRFAARVQVEEGSPAQAAPQLARRSGQQTADQTLDVAGSYRLTRNLDVTAGVRYSQERDRLAALPDVEEQDSQAIYIGTQFRF